MNCGLSIDGIPSLGGPPLLILSSGTRCFCPFVIIIPSSDDSGIVKLFSEGSESGIITNMATSAMPTITGIMYFMFNLPKICF